MDGKITQILRIEDLSHRYHGSSAHSVNKLNFSVGESQIVALTGESGCGKSTTLRLIAGFEVAAAGRVHLAHRVLCGPSTGEWIAPEDRRVGMVFQDHALFPHLNVAANIGFGLPRRGRSKQECLQVENLLTMLELSGLKNRYPHELSGGQQQRVALARAIAPKPDFLLMDEAFNNLDLQLKQRLVPEIRRVLKEWRISTLFVAHDRYEIFDLADQIIVMRQGKIVQEGTAQEIYEAPKEDYVADFFGEVNILNLEGSRYVLRPEHIQIRTGESSKKEHFHDKNDLFAQGIVQVFRYGGPFYEASVRLTDLTSPLNKQIVHIHAPGETVHQEGDRVTITIPYKRLVKI